MWQERIASFEPNFSGRALRALSPNVTAALGMSPYQPDLAALRVMLCKIAWTWPRSERSFDFRRHSLSISASVVSGSNLSARCLFLVHNVVRAAPSIAGALYDCLNLVLVVVTLWLVSWR